MEKYYAMEQNSKWKLLSVQHEIQILFKMEKNTFAKSVATDHV